MERTLYSVRLEMSISLLPFLSDLVDLLFSSAVDFSSFLLGLQTIRVTRPSARFRCEAAYNESISDAKIGRVEG